MSRTWKGGSTSPAGTGGSYARKQRLTSRRRIRVARNRIARSASSGACYTWASICSSPTAGSQRPFLYSRRIPEGDSESSRGQRPRNARPLDLVTLKGSMTEPRNRDLRKNAGANATNVFCDRRLLRPFQGRFCFVTLSGGVAPGYCILPLRGRALAPRGRELLRACPGCREES